ncbi:MAG TPA: PadR family transcriptional regulator [Vicinamibacterales bacterium]|nr:PadR family transcriptional regulator [Vicinamibacterales bacterium]
MRDPVEREFLLTFWKVHILHHAARHGVYGHWMLEELHRHGYRLSPGTLYPILVRMEKRGWLKSSEPERSKAARVYYLTPLGHEVLQHVRGALGELSGKAGSYRAATAKPPSRKSTKTSRPPGRAAGSSRRER